MEWNTSFRHTVSVLKFQSQSVSFVALAISSNRSFWNRNAASAARRSRTSHWSSILLITAAARDSTSATSSAVQARGTWSIAQRAPNAWPSALRSGTPR